MRCGAGVGRSDAGRNRRCHGNEGAGINCLKPFKPALGSSPYLFSSPATRERMKRGLNGFELFEPLLLEDEKS
jgi:hypothetical protein